MRLPSFFRIYVIYVIYRIYVLSDRLVSFFTYYYIIYYLYYYYYYYYYYYIKVYKYQSKVYILQVTKYSCGKKPHRPAMPGTLPADSYHKRL